jgi:hypothetical protein
MEFVILLDGEAIGPFKSQVDAEQYVASDWQRASMTIVRLYRAARGWRRDIRETSNGEDNSLTT